MLFVVVALALARVLKGATLSQVPLQFTITTFRVNIDDVLLVLENVKEDYYKHDVKRASLLCAIMPMVRKMAGQTQTVIGFCCEKHQVRGYTPLTPCLVVSIVVLLFCVCDLCLLFCVCDLLWFLCL